MSSSPIQTPSAKAASLIKRFQTTIDSADANQTPPSSNPSLKKDPLPTAQKRKSISAASPRAVPVPLLSQIKRNLAARSTKPADASPQSNHTLPQGNSHPSPSTPSGALQADKTDDSSQQQPHSNLDPPVDQPAGDQPLDLSEPQSPTDQSSTKPSDNPPSDALKSSVVRRSTATAKPPVHNSKMTKTQPTTRAPLATLTQSQAKSSVPPITRQPLAARKHASLSASTLAPRVNPLSSSRQPISSNNPRLSTPTTAPRVKPQDSQAAASTSQPIASDNKPSPVKAFRKSIGATTPTKSTSTLRTTPKISASPHLAKVDESGAGTSDIRRARTSLKPVKEPSKVAPAKPVPAATQVTKKPVIVKTKSTPLTSVDTKVDIKATLAKKPINAAPSAKIARRISVTDPPKPIKSEPKSAPIPPKKPDLKPIPRARASVAPPVVDIKKPVNPKITAQPATASAKPKATTAHKTPPVISAKNRSTLVKAPPITTKAEKPSTVAAPDPLPTQQPRDQSSAKSQETLPPAASVEKELKPETTIQGSESEPARLPEIEKPEEQENEPSYPADQNIVEKQITPVQSEVGTSKPEESGPPPDEEARPTSDVKDSPARNANGDDTQAKPVGKTESPSHPHSEDHTRAASPQEPENKTPQYTDQHEETLHADSQVNDLVSESKVQEHDSQDGSSASVEKELPPASENVNDNQAELVGEPEPTNHPEDQDLLSRPEEGETEVDQVVAQEQAEKEIISGTSQVDELVGKEPPSSMIGDQDRTTSGEQLLISEKLDLDIGTNQSASLEPRLAIDSQVDGQERVVEQQENQPRESIDHPEKQQVSVASETNESTHEPLSQLENQDRAASEVESESSNVDQKEIQPSNEPETPIIHSRIDSEVDQEDNNVDNQKVSVVSETDESTHERLSLLENKSLPASPRNESKFENVNVDEDHPVSPQNELASESVNVDQKKVQPSDAPETPIIHSRIDSEVDQHDDERISQLENEDRPASPNESESENVNVDQKEVHPSDEPGTPIIHSRIDSEVGESESKISSQLQDHPSSPQSHASPSDHVKEEEDKSENKSVDGAENLINPQDDNEERATDQFDHQNQVKKVSSQSKISSQFDHPRSAPQIQSTSVSVKKEDKESENESLDGSQNLIDPQDENEEGATDQFNYENQAKKEIVSPNSETDVLVRESTPESRSQQQEDERLVLISKKQIDDVDHIETPVDLKDHSGSLDPETVPAHSKVVNLGAPQLAKSAIPANEADQLYDEYPEEDKMDAESENSSLHDHDRDYLAKRVEPSAEEENLLPNKQLAKDGGNQIEEGSISPKPAVTSTVGESMDFDTESENLVVHGNYLVYRDEPSAQEKSRIDILPNKQVTEERKNAIEESNISPESLVTGIVDQSVSEPREQLDRRSQSPRSEESDHQFEYKEQSAKEIIPTSQSVVGPQLAQSTNEDQVPRREEMEDEVDQVFDIEPEANPVQAVGESQVEPDSQSVDHVPTTRSETPESEGDQFVYHSRVTEQEPTVVNPELEQTSEVTPESDDDQFVYSVNQTEKEMTPVHPQFESSTSFIEAGSTTTETPKLPILPSFDHFSIHAEYKTNSRNEAYPPASAQEEFDDQDEEILDESGAESESIVFQLEEDDPPASISEDQGNETSQFDNLNQGNKQTNAPTFQVDEKIASESTPESHSPPLVEQEPNLISELKTDFFHHSHDDNQVKHSEITSLKSEKQPSELSNNSLEIQPEYREDLNVSSSRVQV